MKNIFYLWQRRLARGQLEEIAWCYPAAASKIEEYKIFYCEDRKPDEWLHDYCERNAPNWERQVRNEE